MRLQLVILFFLLTPFFGYSQNKYYLGFIIKANLATHLNTSANYLSDFPLFTKPIKIEEKSQWNSNIVQTSQGLGILAGLQSKKTFLEFAILPFNSLGFSIEGFNIGSIHSKLEEEYRTIKYNYDVCEINFSAKYLLTGRKRFRLLGVIGAGTMYLYRYDTYYGSKKDHFLRSQYFLLNEVQKKFYHNVNFGLEYMFSTEYNAMVGLNYAKQITSFDNRLGIGYLSLNLNVFLYKKQNDKKIYSSD